jgi:hypothetical protein
VVRKFTTVGTAAQPILRTIFISRLAPVGNLCDVLPEKVPVLFKMAVAEPDVYDRFRNFIYDGPEAIGIRYIDLLSLLANLRYSTTWDMQKE